MKKLLLLLIIPFLSFGQCDDSNPCVQTINLEAGWNLISIYIEANSMNVSDIFEPIVDDLIYVKDQYGNIYWPDFGLNTIGNCLFDEGLQVCVENATQLSISGNNVAPLDMVIDFFYNSWNILPYLNQPERSIEYVLQDIIDDVIIVKDIEGNVYWPEHGVNQINNLKPGQSYLIGMYNNNNTLNYNPINDTIINNSIITPFTDSPFGVINPHNFSDNMTVLIPEGILPDDEPIWIAVKNCNNILSGAILYTGEKTAITVFGNNLIYDPFEGLAYASNWQSLGLEEPSLEWYLLLDGEEQKVEVNYSFGNSYYQQNSLSGISGISSFIYSDCDDVCLNDLDGDEVCDEEEILGCRDENGCNYNPDATDDGICEYPALYYDCYGNCLNDVDSDSLCDELDDCIGIYDECGECNGNGPQLYYDCYGNCLNDIDSDSICDELDDCIGQFDECGECNGNGPQLYYDCYGNCLVDFDQDGMCDELDNCPEYYNPNQEDFNNDGIGDACDGISLIENDSKKNLLITIDILGRETNTNKGFQLHIYDDGSVEKKYLIK